MKLSVFGSFGRNCREWVAILRIFRRIDRQHAIWLVKHFDFVMGGALSARSHLPLMHDGSPLPWYTYAAMHFLDQFDFSLCNVFEFGSGNSSKYWAKRAASVCSVEINEHWYKHVSAGLQVNQKLILELDPQRYAEAISSSGCLYDVIIVDGAVRRMCAPQAVARLKEGGMIILDNSDWFPETVNAIRAQGFQQIDFIGPGPINKYTWATSLFFKEAMSIPRKQNNGVITVTGGIEKQEHDDKLPGYAG